MISDTRQRTNKIDLHNSSTICWLFRHNLCFFPRILNIGVHSAISQYLIPMGSVELNPRSKRTKSDADYWPGTSNQPLSIVYNDQLVTIGNYTLCIRCKGPEEIFSWICPIKVENLSGPLNNPEPFRKICKGISSEYSEKLGYHQKNFLWKFWRAISFYLLLVWL